MRAQIGLIVAIPSLCQFLLSIPSGMVSDRFDPKRLIAASILIAAVGALLGSVSAGPWMYIVASTLLTFNSTLYNPLLKATSPTSPTHGTAPEP